MGAQVETTIRIPNATQVDRQNGKVQISVVGRDAAGEPMRPFIQVPRELKRRYEQGVINDLEVRAYMNLAADMEAAMSCSLGGSTLARFMEYGTALDAAKTGGTNLRFLDASRRSQAALRKVGPTARLMLQAMIERGLLVTDWADEARSQGVSINRDAASGALKVALEVLVDHYELALAA